MSIVLILQIVSISLYGLTVISYLLTKLFERVKLSRVKKAEVRAREEQEYLEYLKWRETHKESK